MKIEPMAVRHLDLSVGRDGPDGDGRPALVILWWRDLPLGVIAGSADELPFSRATLEAELARLAAEQRASRDPSLGAPLEGGAEGAPKRKLTVDDAARCAGTLDWLDSISNLPCRPADSLSVIVCTRDRGAMLARCLANIAAQESPPGELIVVDNSPDASAAEVCARHPGVRHVHEPRPGLSHARNAGIAAATRPLVAFTDDDVEPHARWTGEVVRALEDSGCEAMTGIVLPVRLDTPAQAYFQMRMGGFGMRFVPARYGRTLYEETLAEGPHVWRIGAGANMAFRKSVFERVGLFDPRLGAGASGCSEDSELWYRIIATGGCCQYEPRGVVYHDHRADWGGLRRQMRDYLQGHVSALVAQADMFGDKGNLRRIYRQLPAYFAREGVEAYHTGERERLRVLWEEFSGWVSGLRYPMRREWRQSRPRPPLVPAQASEETEA